MIRAQARADHQTETGHSGYRGTTDETGRIVCTQCPWQYPPAPEGEHQHDSACNDGTRYCPTRDYEANPIDAPTDPEPAMGPIDEDPGPVPDDAPEVPVLTLRDRIANVLGTYFGMDDPNPGLGALADCAQLVDAVHAVVGAGADWAPRTEGTAMTPAQALAYLLDLPEWARIDRLGRLLDEATKASRCFTEDHDGAMQMNLALQMSEARNRDALNRIGKLCTNLDGGETDLQNMIGTIAAEALVRQ